MKEVKSIDTFFDFNFKYTIYKNNQSGNCILVIPGWLTNQSNWDLIINKIDANIIIFDHYGTGTNEIRNKRLARLYLNNEALLRESILRIMKSHNISTIVGISAGTSFLLNNIDIFLNKKLIFVSPQLERTLIDTLMYILLNFIFVLEKITNKRIFHYFANATLIKRIWVHTVSKGSYNPQTFTNISNGLKSITKFWSIQHFNDMFNQKGKYKDSIDKLSKLDYLFVIGNKDNVLNVKAFVDKCKGYGLNNIKILEGSHNLESEAVDDLVKIIKKF